MFRVTAFTDGGVVVYNRNNAEVPTKIVNELITKVCIDTSRSEAQHQIRLGKSGEFTGRLVRDADKQFSVAVLFPAALWISDSEQIASDIVRIYAGVDDDLEKFEALADLRLKDVENTAPADKSSTINIKTESLRLEETSPTLDLKKAGKSAPKVKSTKSAKKSSKNAKKKRTWDGDSGSDSDTPLDYSSTSAGVDSTITPTEKLNALDLGSKSKQGFVVKELKDELSELLDKKNDVKNNASSEQFGFLKKFIGGKKLEDKDLDQVLKAMEDHLVMRNVATDVASSICSAVRKDLVGTSTLNWTSVKETVRNSMKKVLEKILTPGISTDLLASISRIHRQSTAKHDRRPFVISVVGVNGVGKSTNLGKLAFWFLQNDFKVLIAACDTFRSGAVEQLKVHVQRLNQLKGTAGEVELFDQGYGKDAAVIAKHAVEYGTRKDFDVVLIDTAGRRHNDDRLMSSLEKFGSLAQPDKIIMVGEALVGTDSVEQAKNFDAAFGRSRHLDFFLISKCDTVGEMLGTLVNVTYATGVPVLFVGTGQQYTDLRTLSVEWAVDRLLS